MSILYLFRYISLNLSLRLRTLNNEKNTLNRENKLSSQGILHMVRDLQWFALNPSLVEKTHFASVLEDILHWLENRCSMLEYYIN